MSLLEETIRRRAYELWVQENRPDGKDGEHWTRAKAEVEALRQEMEAVTQSGRDVRPPGIGSETRLKLKPQDLDLLAGVWIIACNDENPLITFEGIIFRLGLAAADRDRVKELVRSRGELFRYGAPKDWLVDWKCRMVATKIYPSWIRAHPADERERLARQLQPGDIFRSQFRADADAPRSDVDLIKWGLDHLDRLGKPLSEKWERRTRLTTGVVIPVLALGLTALTITTSYWTARGAQKAAGRAALLQRESIQAQINAKDAELRFSPKLRDFAAASQSMLRVYQAATQRDAQRMQAELDGIKATLYDVEPLLANADSRKALWKFYADLAKSAGDVLTSSTASSQAAGGRNAIDVDATVSEFRSRLIAILF